MKYCLMFVVLFALQIVAGLQIANAATLDELYNSTSKPVAETTTLTLSWTPPTTRQNGDPLTAAELGGYEIYQVNPDGTDKIILVEDGAATSHEIEISESGEYMFAIASVDADGLKSDISEAVSADVVPSNPPAGVQPLPVSAYCATGSICVFNLK